MKNLYERIAEKDQRNIIELRHRIDLSNLLANEVDDLIFSGKQITHLEWKALKKTANRNKAFLVKVHKDPKLKVFLHLQENQELETTLSKQLERSLIDAIDRLSASINVIDNEITTNKNFIKGLSLEEEALIAVYKEEIITRDRGKIYQHYSYYMDRDNRTRDNKRIDSQKKITNYFKRIEKIKSYLPESAQRKANDELSTLKANLGK